MIPSCLCCCGLREGGNTGPRTVVGFQRVILEERLFEVAQACAVFLLVRPVIVWRRHAAGLDLDVGNVRVVGTGSPAGQDNFQEVVRDALVLVHHAAQVEGNDVFFVYRRQLHRCADIDVRLG